MEAADSPRDGRLQGGWGQSPQLRYEIVSTLPATKSYHRGLVAPNSRIVTICYVSAILADTVRG